MKAQPAFFEQGFKKTEGYMDAVNVREALAGDIDIFWEFLAIAAYEPSGQVARAVPVVAAHLKARGLRCDRRT